MAADEPTSYTVYRHDLTEVDEETVPALFLVGSVRAHDARRAVTAVAKEDGSFVAIPTRSLKTHTVKTETQLRITVT